MRDSSGPMLMSDSLQDVCAVAHAANSSHSASGDAGGQVSAAHHLTSMPYLNSSSKRSEPGSRFCKRTRDQDTQAARGAIKGLFVHGMPRSSCGGTTASWCPRTSTACPSLPWHSAAPLTSWRAPHQQSSPCGPPETALSRDERSACPKASPSQSPNALQPLTSWAHSACHKYKHC